MGHRNRCRRQLSLGRGSLPWLRAFPVLQLSSERALRQPRRRRQTAPRSHQRRRSQPKLTRAARPIEEKARAGTRRAAARERGRRAGAAARGDAAARAGAAARDGGVVRGGEAALANAAARGGGAARAGGRTLGDEVGPDVVAGPEGGAGRADVLGAVLQGGGVGLADGAAPEDTAHATGTAKATVQVNALANAQANAKVTQAFRRLVASCAVTSRGAIALGATGAVSHTVETHATPTGIARNAERWSSARKASASSAAHGVERAVPATIHALEIGGAQAAE